VRVHCLVEGLRQRGQVRRRRTGGCWGCSGQQQRLEAYRRRRVRRRKEVWCNSATNVSHARHKMCWNTCVPGSGRPTRAKRRSTWEATGGGSCSREPAPTDGCGSVSTWRSRSRPDDVRSGDVMGGIMCGAVKWACLCRTQSLERVSVGHGPEGAAVLDVHRGEAPELPHRGRA
jgi:hypothetical protein